jgi:hypothetical protein
MSIDVWRRFAFARGKCMSGTSRVNREVYARFCRRLEVKFLRPTWRFAPPGSNRSSGRGNEVAEAFGEEGRDGDLASVQAIIRVNAEQASKRLMQEPTLRFCGEGRSQGNGTSEWVPLILPG